MTKSTKKLAKLASATVQQADATVRVPPIPGVSYLTNSGEIHAVFPAGSINIDHLRAIELDSKGHARTGVAVQATPDDTYTVSVRTGPETAAVFSMRNMRVDVSLSFVGYEKLAIEGATGEGPQAVSAVSGDHDAKTANTKTAKKPAREAA